MITSGNVTVHHDYFKIILIMIIKIMIIITNLIYMKMIITMTMRMNMTIKNLFTVLTVLIADRVI